MVKGMTSCRPPESEISNEKSNESQIDLINRIECAIRHIESSLDVDPWAVEIAVEAMEKQIPKKPKKSKAPRIIIICGVKFKYYDWVCPICGEFLAFETKIKSNHHHHHCVCGQAIGWEGE